MKGRKWTYAEDKLLIDMAAEHMTSGAMAETLGRTRSAVKTRMERLGVSSGIRVRYDWPMLLEMARQGKTTGECAEAAGVKRRRFRAAARSRFGMSWEELTRFVAADRYIF